jgi:hypothetical protein
VIVGDSIWDLLAAGRSKALGVGLRSGGYGEAELFQAGAYRVYENPGDLLEHIAEMGHRAQRILYRISIILRGHHGETRRDYKQSWPKARSGST